MLGDRAWQGKLLAELCALIVPVFAQARSRMVAFAYVAALLAVAGDRKSCWQLGEQAGHATPRRMQALLAEYAWDWHAALEGLQRFVLAHLADPDAILVLDETAELKKGTMTVGVGRQHAGITGQIENCQTVVFLAYVTARAHKNAGLSSGSCVTHGATNSASFNQSFPNSLLGESLGIMCRRVINRSNDHGAFSILA